MKDKELYLLNLRHSAAHLLAKAVKDLWPGTHNAIGPAIENGFYQDFDFGSVKITESDLPRIEKRMGEILPHWKQFVFNEVTLQRARELFKDNPYKLELMEEFAQGGKKLLTNDPGDFLDLCKMGHVENPSKELKHFKLLSIAGAYWRGSEKNKMLTRIYGTVFPTKEALNTYLTQLEEAKKRDHRKLGRDLDLFLISEAVGSGLPLFTPKGQVLRQTIIDFLIKVKKERNYQYVWTPHVARSQLYHTSGHWGKYDAMFSPMKIEDEEYVVKPMNCPHHFQIYLSKPRSYRELPFRIAENGTVYRNEKSGELNGLLRVRSLTVDDTHTFIRQSQIYDELGRVLALVKEVLTTFGFSQYHARISVRDLKHPEKYLGSVDNWEQAEAALKKAAQNLGFDFAIGQGEAAFYGPKIDIMVKDSLGRQWQLSTVQLDYNQPHNFEMTYTDEKGEQSYPAILHIAVVGSIERFLAVLIEHYAGAFPLWLSPVQVAILPITDRHGETAQAIYDRLNQEGIRVELNTEKKTLQAKIREHTLQKVPYMCIIGQKEVEKSSKDQQFVSVRTREGQDRGMINIYEFINDLKGHIENKT